MKQELPEYNVQICHPNNKLEIEFVSDYIKTLEGVPAGLPYGGTSGSWGDSGKGWTEQHGTPIGADITYYSGYEDTFYRLNVDFPVEKVKDYMQRAYAVSEGESSEPLEEYKRPGKQIQSGGGNPYNSFTDLIFGFAPKGMVVVWLQFSSVRIELGRYQAEVIKDDKALEKKLFASWTMNREQVKARDFNPDASPVQWDNYRIRYNWKPKITSSNSNFRLLKIYMEYYNAEREIMFRPWVLSPPERARAIPKQLNFVWTTGKGEQYVGKAFFDWETTNEAFKKAGGKGNIEFKIAPDNDSYEVFIDNQPLKMDSMRIFKDNYEYKDSY
ncbi:DUF2931 family protein [Chryseobacterium sp. c4a]|uniref:DUF2931 family protein n=1 Tax=Chryseobacterium sp. c4a TaxID=1573582 RepID=UPI001E63D554|nr:DUF2931 family protein [Chryseobacterium sp. c4a]